MIRIRTLAALLAVGLAPAPVVAAQTQTAAVRPSGLAIRTFAGAGLEWFTAASTFGAVLGSGSGHDLGGGLNLTRGPVFLEVGARRFQKTGERVFVGAIGEVFPLGIPATIRLTPLDIAAGWRFAPRFGRFVPFLGGGYTRLRYEETSDFAAADEDVDESFNGFHVKAGAEVRLARWIGLTGEAVWTSIPNAIGTGGASQAFDETNLGGTSIRLSLVIGR